MPSDQLKESTVAVHSFTGSLQALNLGALTVSNFGDVVNWTNNPNFKVTTLSPWVELPVRMFDAVDTDIKNDVAASEPVNVAESQAPDAQQVENVVPAVAVESAPVELAHNAAEIAVAETMAKDNNLAADRAAELAKQADEAIKVEAANAEAAKQAAEVAARLKQESEAKTQADLALAESQRAAAERARAERVAAEMAEAELAATKLALAEQAETANLESKRALAEQAELASAETTRLATERLEVDLAEGNRLAAEKLAAEKLAAELALSAFKAKDQARKLAEQKAFEEESPSSAEAGNETQTPVQDVEPVSAIQASRATRIVASAEKTDARPCSERGVSRAISPPKKLSNASSVAALHPVTGSTSQSTEDYLAKLERLVLELNMELGRRSENEEEDPVAQLSQRIIELNLENMDLRERLQISESKK